MTLPLDELRLRLKLIYADLPIVPCKGLCHYTCTVIPFSPVEARVIREVHGVILRFNEKTQRCSALVDKRCSVYDDRPLICRVFGVADGSMVCPHGCHPLPSPVTKEQVSALMDRICDLEDL